jgi:hypothetical protein
MSAVFRRNRRDGEELGYHTCMSDSRAEEAVCAAPPAGCRERAGGSAGAVQVRVLPDGVSRAATLLSRRGHIMRLDLGACDALPGAALEIEAGTVLYWGELSSRGDLGCVVKLEHSLDRASLDLNRDRWG